MINAPVLHVNGDHPEGMQALSPDSVTLTRSIDVVRAMEIAFQYRQYFRKDIIIDLLVYRRWSVFFVFELLILTGSQGVIFQS